LAAFKNDKAPIPEWRLQLQNSIRQRNGRSPVIAEAPAVRPATTTSGANALKVQYEPNRSSRPTRGSRTHCGGSNSRAVRICPGKKRVRGFGSRRRRRAQRNYPFNVVARSGGVSERVTPPVEKSVTVTEPASVRPKLISSLKIEKKRYDTNKLVPIPEAETMAPKSG
jgi:hypothetical protein